MQNCRLHAYKKYYYMDYASQQKNNATKENKKNNYKLNKNYYTNNIPNLI